LNDRVSSNTGITPAVTGDVTSLTLKQIDAFSPDKLKEAMRNPKFTQHWDKLLSEADKRNRERGLTNF